jgi:four helix bundle protein
MKHNDRRPLPRRHFDHHRLDAWHIAKEALIEGLAILDDVPRGHGKLKDQAQRALSSSFTLTSEGAARTGADRSCRMRWARAEANESAAVFEVLGDLKLIEQPRIDSQLDRLWRLSATLTGLARVRY